MLPVRSVAWLATCDDFGPAPWAPSLFLPRLSILFASSIQIGCNRGHIFRELLHFLTKNETTVVAYLWRWREASKMQWCAGKASFRVQWAANRCMWKGQVGCLKSWDSLDDARLLGNLAVSLFELWTCALFWAFSMDSKKRLGFCNVGFSSSAIIAGLMPSRQAQTTPRGCREYTMPRMYIAAIAKTHQHRIQDWNTKHDTRCVARQDRQHETVNQNQREMTQARRRGWHSLLMLKSQSNKHSCTDRVSSIQPPAHVPMHPSVPPLSIHHIQTYTCEQCDRYGSLTSHHSLQASDFPECDVISGVGPFFVSSFGITVIFQVDLLGGFAHSWPLGECRLPASRADPFVSLSSPVSPKLLSLISAHWWHADSSKPSLTRPPVGMVSCWCDAPSPRSV